MNVLWLSVLITCVFAEFTTDKYNKAENEVFSEETQTPTEISATTPNSCSEPPNVKNFTNIIPTSTEITLQWEPPENPECYDEFIIYLNDDIYNKTTETEITITNLTACTEYRVSIATSKDNVSGEKTEQNITTELDLPEINISLINATSFEVYIKWEIPENTQCLDGYVIYLNDEEKDRTINNEYTIKDLKACVDGYKVGVAATKDDKVGPITNQTFDTVSPNPFDYSVGNLAVEQVDEILNVTWDAPPDEVIECVTNYYVLWWPDNGTTTGNTTEETYLELTPIVGCMNYHIDVKPQVGESQQGNVVGITYQADPHPTNAPVIVTGSLKPHKKQIEVIWETDDKKKNMCNVTAITITCDAPNDSNSDFSWIVKHAQSVKEVTEQTSNNRYTMSVDNLSPFTNYSCSGVVTNTGGNSTGTQFNVSTLEDVPSAPLSLQITNIGPNNFTIEWSEPEIIPGVMTKYGLKIDSLGPFYTLNKECSNNASDHFYDLDAQTRKFVFNEALSYFEYNVVVYGVDGAGNGTEANKTVATEATAPDTVENADVLPPEYSQNDTYSASVTVKFDPPCNVNGPLKYYEIHYIGTRQDFNNEEYTIPTNDTNYVISLKPERNYSIEISVVTENFRSDAVSLPMFESRAGVPNISMSLQAPTTEETKAYFSFKKADFDNTNGEIIAYALILFSEAQDMGTSYGFWDGTNETWPTVNKQGTQLTPNLWNPFKNGADSVNFTIGDDSCGSNYCNKVLNDDTKYWLIVRGLTRAAYKDSSLLPFKTDLMDQLDLALILGLTFGLLALLILIIFLIILWRRNRKRSAPVEEKPILTTTPDPISCQKFPLYYKNLQENPHIVKQQFTELDLQSKSAAAITYATLPENKRKNRYTNILPFDETRVKLKIDEDDEMASDYINASYIKGYSGKSEYIATQGPLESTTRDFWKMILQENVSIIVMVSQFVEQSKEKCYHYFPNNHETATFGESLNVKCCTELHFGTYCIRTLQVCKGTDQRHVIHMQFLEWPDFGVPLGTDNMLQFCRQIREKANGEGGLIVIHCSAGVGRTGTLIALDILLQTIDDHRDINIYKTVLDLRKQRSNMVQTEKQYMFIHTCINDYLETPMIQTNDSTQEQIYENMDVIKHSLKKNLIETEVESAL